MTGRGSIPSNIGEGCDHESKADYLRFLSIAFGSLRELYYQVSLAKRLHFLPEQAFLFVEPKIIETEKVLNRLINARRDS